MRRQPDAPVSRMHAYGRVVVRRLRLLKIRLTPGTPKLDVANDFAIGPRPRIKSPAFFRSGRSVWVGADFHCESNLSIGDNVLISSRVAFVGNDHDFSDPEVPITETNRLPAANAVVEGNNLIGFGTLVIGNVCIGRGAIVGAGSVVTRDVPANTVSAGVPARVIRQRYVESS